MLVLSTVICHPGSIEKLILLSYHFPVFSWEEVQGWGKFREEKSAWEKKTLAASLAVYESEKCHC